MRCRGREGLSESRRDFRANRSHSGPGAGSFGRCRVWGGTVPDCTRSGSRFWRKKEVGEGRNDDVDGNPKYSSSLGKQKAGSETTGIRPRTWEDHFFSTGEG